MGRASTDTSVVIAVNSVNMRVPGTKLTKLFRPGEEIPTDWFKEEKLRTKLANGVIRYKGKKAAKQDEIEPVIATPGKRPIIMSTGSGLDDIPDP